MFCLKNNRIQIFSFVVLLPLIFNSCNQKSEVSKIYDIDSLIDAQVSYLSGHKAVLQKSAFIAGAEDDSTFSPADTTSWKHELEVFRKLNEINKPVNQKSYLIDDGLYDPSSNLTVKAFSATEDLPVRYIRVFYQESIHKPRKIEALYNDQNALYKSEKILSLEFNQIDNKSILTSYSIEGGQKMVLADSVSYLIRGKITID
jgi:hypothetical protein